MTVWRGLFERRPSFLDDNTAGKPVTVILPLYTMAMLALGGGGSVAPDSELACQLVAAAMFAAWLLANPADRSLPHGASIALVLLFILPLLQLVPLPPALWSRLPGRAAEHAALALIGQDGAWMPISVSPPRTLASLLSLAPPALALVMASTLNARGRMLLLATIALGGLASVLLGALQLADGLDRTWRFYDDNSGYLNGFQANRNAEVDVLLIGLLAAVAAVALLRGSMGRRLGERAAAWTAAGAAVVLVAGAVLTGSRAGIALIPLVGVLALVTWRGIRSRLVLVGAALAGAAAALAPLLVAQVQSLQMVAARFNSGPDFRFELWRDTRTAIAAYWPLGSGVGTFKPVFIAAERLAVVDPTRPVRAHNDYLEFVLEGGLGSLIVLLAAGGGLVWLFAGALRRATGAQRPVLMFGLGTVLVIALHSVVDYPLRSMALAHLGAVAVGMVMAVRASQVSGDEGDERGFERA